MVLVYVGVGYSYSLILGYWYMFTIDYSHMLVTCCWNKLVQFYSGIFHSENVTMVSLVI